LHHRLFFQVQGQVNVTAIRFFSASLLDLGESPRATHYKNQVFIAVELCGKGKGQEIELIPVPQI
jgi:hypothetical protein